MTRDFRDRGVDGVVPGVGKPGKFGFPNRPALLFRESAFLRRSPGIQVGFHYHRSDVGVLGLQQISADLALSDVGDPRIERHGITMGQSNIAVWDNRQIDMDHSYIGGPIRSGAKEVNDTMASALPKHGKCRNGVVLDGLRPSRSLMKNSDAQG